MLRDGAVVHEGRAESIKRAKLMACPSRHPVYPPAKFDFGSHYLLVAALQKLVLNMGSQVLFAAEHDVCTLRIHYVQIIMLFTHKNSALDLIRRWRQSAPARSAASSWRVGTMCAPAMCCGASPWRAAQLSRRMSRQSPASSTSLHREVAAAHPAFSQRSSLRRDMPLTAGINARTAS